MSQHHLTPAQIEAINHVRTAAAILQETITKYLPERGGNIRYVVTDFIDAIAPLSPPQEQKPSRVLVVNTIDSPVPVTNANGN
jgi:hypothetical protein